VIVAIPTVNIASELTSGRIMHGVLEVSFNLSRISKASKQAGANVIGCAWDFRNKSVNGAVRSLK
jgi:hypothetical protein